MRTTTHQRRRRLLGAGLLSAAVIAGTLTMTAPQAMAATLFSADFESGAGGWSKSGGDWSVVSDGSPVFQQASSTVERARQFAGSTGWTDYAVQARVKPLSFGGGGVVALAARVTSATKMYRLALTGANRAELQVMDGSAITVLGSAALTVSTGSWYTLRIDAAGSTLRGYVNGTTVGSATSTAYSAGRIGLVTAYASGRFDDVTVTDSGTTPPTSASPTGTQPTSPPPTSPPPTTPPPANNSALVGWATQGGGTTGGAGGSTVTVSSLSALTTAVSGDSAAVVRVSGLFSCSDDVRVGANKTILGVGPGSGLTGCGLNIRDVGNVIVRNMNISKVPAGNGNGDAIHVDNATRLWIDHNDLSSDTTHGTDYYDGLLDLTHGTDYVTVSWNRLHDHVKCSLVGHSDSNSGEDTGHLRITYHHNAFVNCAQRNPRVRFGNPVHVYNNYYATTNSPEYSYGIATTCGAGVLVESNYFENVADPTHMGEGSSPVGNLVARNNYLVNSGPVLTNGSVAGIPYSYTADAAGSVKSIVTSGAGTDKITT
jgi:pectate lyase